MNGNFSSPNSEYFNFYFLSFWREINSHKLLYTIPKIYNICFIYCLFSIFLQYGMRSNSIYRAENWIKTSEQFDIWSYMFALHEDLMWSNFRQIIRHINFVIVFYLDFHASKKDILHASDTTLSFFLKHLSKTWSLLESEKFFPTPLFMELWFNIFLTYKIIFK